MKYPAFNYFPILSFFLVFSILNSAVSLAQKQANIWHFGDGRSIDFSSGVPVMLSGSQIQGAKSGSASYCDSFGNLLFYTNGGGREPFTGQATGSIWNRNHTVMHDMAGVEGGGVTRQNSIIVEAPGQDSVYYLFTMDEVTWDLGASATTIAAQPGGRGLSYFTIDMRLNNGLGNIVVASQLVFTPSYSALTAIRHANGHDYWIINHLNSVGFGVFLLNSAGVFQIGSYVLPAPYFINNTTQLKASPDGSMIFSATGIWSAPDPLVISFDKATGQLSNPVLLPDFGAEPEFSPNSRYLYGFKEISLSATSHRYRIIRFDLQNLSNIPTPDIIDSLSFSGFTFMHPQLAPDGNIYTMTSNSSNLYHRIDRISCPNTQQATLDTGVFAYTTNVNDFLHYLPNFPPHLFENDDDAFVDLGPDTVRICDLGSSFVLNAQNPGASYLWSTGDTTQSITITAPGAYSVTVNGFCGTGSDQVVVLPCDVQTNACNVYEYTGAVQTWTVPSGVDTIYVKMWGAAGGGGPDNGNNWGGGGGYTEAVIPVNAGQTIEIYVGGGGIAADKFTGGAGGWPNGGNGGSGNRIEAPPLDTVGGAGGGGGRSEIRIAGVSYAIAGGGGGGAANRYGGCGGGLNAEYTAATNNFNIHGFGGTQTSGGAPASNTICPHPVSGTAGASLQGGTGATDLGGSLNDRTGGGGGGDGYFGGGGGGSHDGCFGVGSAGGGGSGFVSSAPGISGFTQSSANFFLNPGLPANNSDPLLLAYPVVGTGIEGENGGPGLVQICFSTSCSTQNVSLTADACSSYVAPNGAVLTQSGVYNFTLVSTQGCDSLITLNLTIKNTATGQQDIFSCGPFTAADGTVYNQSTTFTRVLTSANGCDSIVTNNLTIGPLPAVSAGLDAITITEGDTIQLNASGALSYVWSPVDGLSCLTCPSPLAVPVEGITYTVTGTDAAGCTATDNIRIAVEVKCNELFMPDIFTPDGNGPAVNERLCVFSNCIRLFSLMIYNRWGEQVFETTDIDSCWDGTYKGIAVSPGLYAYKLYAELRNGQVIDRKGTVTLVR